MSGPSVPLRPWTTTSGDTKRSIASSRPSSHTSLNHCRASASGVAVIESPFEGSGIRDQGLAILKLVDPVQDDLDFPHRLLVIGSAYHHHQPLSIRHHVVVAAAARVADDPVLTDLTDRAERELWLGGDAIREIAGAVRIREQFGAVPRPARMQAGTDLVARPGSRKRLDEDEWTRVAEAAVIRQPASVGRKRRPAHRHVLRLGMERTRGFVLQRQNI